MRPRRRTGLLRSATYAFANPDRFVVQKGEGSSPQLGDIWYVYQGFHKRTWKPTHQEAINWAQEAARG